MSTLYDDEIVVSKSEFKRLAERDLKLEMLEAYGVDNWIGYDDAMQCFKEELQNSEDEE